MPKTAVPICPGGRGMELGYEENEEEPGRRRQDQRRGLTRQDLRLEGEMPVHR